MSTRTLAPAPESSVSWPWLTLAAEMAATRYVLPPARVARGPARYGYFPRVATRTPGSDLASVPAARDFVRSTLRRWNAEGRSDDITLVVSELLANALRHAPPRPGGWPVQLGLLQVRPCAALLCAVADPSPAPPVPAPPGDLAESGRGLHVVEALSDRWSYTTPTHRGKVVWATFAAAAITFPES